MRKIRYRYLSHIIEDGMPAYRGAASVKIKAVKSIFRNDSANVSSASLVNHWGTHIDLPRHMFDGGPAVCDYKAKFWAFRSPCVITMRLKPSELVRSDDLRRFVRKSHDIILFRSMWSRRRSKREYVYLNPGIHPETAAFLRGNFPNIRAVGIDWISVSSYKDRSTGRLAHKAFLDPERSGSPIAVIEDMDLSGPMNNLAEIFALPLRVKGFDSAPVTVLGVFHG